MQNPPRWHSRVQKNPENCPFSRLIFLIDVSGSMGTPMLLPLAKAAIDMMLGTMLPEDYACIVIYAADFNNN
jgi:hypothetical protein